MLNCAVQDEYTTKVSGDGDGIKHVARKRVPVPSSRKFTAIPREDDVMKLKLESILNEMNERPGRAGNEHGKKKAESIAESTPTKIARRHKLKSVIARNCTAHSLHATPRRTETPSAPEKKRKERAGQIVFRCLLLNAWRLYRARLATLTESLQRRDGEISQLKIQTDVLQNLRKSECNRRDDVNAEHQQTKKKLELYIEQNLILIEERDVLKNDCLRLEEILTELNDKLQNTKNDLKAMLSDARSHKQKYEQERSKSKKLTEEKRILLDKASKLENFINVQRESITNLENALKNAENSVINLEAANSNTKGECNELKKQLHSEMGINNNLEEKISLVQREREEQEYKIEGLQCQLNYFIRSYEELELRTNSFRANIDELTIALTEEQNQNWWIKLKEFAASSYSLVQCVAYIMLPALPNLERMENIATM